MVSCTIGEVRCSATNETIWILQVLRVVFMPSADHHFLECTSKIASASHLRGYGP